MASSNDSSSDSTSFRNDWTKYLLTQSLINKIRTAQPPPARGPSTWPQLDDDATELPSLPDGWAPEPPEHAPRASAPKVAIIGAGAAGLFTALVLDFLNKQTDLGGFKVDYDIFEAAGADRVGGRLFTYKFDSKQHNSKQQTAPTSVDLRYYDVGAMRFPDSPVMTRLFDLFSFLKMEKVDSLKTDTPAGSLIPYFMKNMVGNNQMEPFCYNNITKWGSYGVITKASPSFDPFMMNADKKIDESVLALGADRTFKAAIRSLRDNIKNDPGTGWAKLMACDQYTTRAYLGLPPENVSLDPSDPSPAPSPPYNYETIGFLETFNGGSLWYDQALSESVLESLDFDYADDIDWRCILGGAQELAKNMEKKLATKPTYNSRVVAIKTVDSLTLSVKVKNQPAKKYAGVFSSTTLGALSHIDTKDLNLSYGARLAIRTLAYGPSAKVAILFDHPWWKTDLKSHNITSGGQGHSDLNIRTCIYPSYNVNLGEKDEAVLLCSYTWQQDALRLGAWMRNQSAIKPNAAKQDDTDDLLKELLIRELAQMHAHDEVDEATLYDIIHRSYRSHYAHDWSQDPNTAGGAFAFFGATQFSMLWPDLVHVTGNLVMIGEAVSPHHAWVVGAIESAISGLYQWLGLRPDIPGSDKAREFLATAQAGVPFTGLPFYMDTHTASWAALLGALDHERFIEERPG